MEVISEHAAFGGTQGFYRHVSGTIGLPMRFSVFVPPQAQSGPVPVLFYLAGLTCTEETFPMKAAAQAHAAQHGLMLVAPDTSPRDSGEAGADAAWDFGYGAGFYLDATEAPWSAHWKMESYITGELLGLVLSSFPARPDRVGIFGHSMGGHGALTLALRHPGKYASVSAFAPIAAPSQCPWGEKAFGGYLGSGRDAWGEHDATGPGRQVSRRAAAPRETGGRLPGDGPAAHAASPARLRPRLLLRRDLHGRPHRAPRAHALRLMHGHDGQAALSDRLRRRGTMPV
jgi:S-formylglutathione hydrolase